MSRYQLTRREFEDEALSNHMGAEAEERWIASLTWLDRFMYESKKLREDLKVLIRWPTLPF